MKNFQRLKCRALHHITALPKQCRYVPLWPGMYNTEKIRYSNSPIATSKYSSYTKSLKFSSCNLILQLVKDKKKAQVN